jgi:carboxypeptidase C (cathepsin A)
MLYVDQPIGAGFSYGTQSVNSTATAAPYVWIFLQAFFSLLPRYESREFGLFTESYGGHYGPGKVDCKKCFGFSSDMAPSHRVFILF